MNNGSTTSGAIVRVYLIYSIIKLLSISSVLLTDESPCSPTLKVLLILYVITEVYEILFLLLICAYSSWYEMPHCVVKTGQIIYEAFRNLITVSIGYTLIGQSDCLKTRTGAISLILVFLGIIKVIFFMVFVFFYCRLSNTRRRIPNRLVVVTEADISQFIVQNTDLKEECPICLDDTDQTQQFAQLPCSHIFHHECLKQWVSVKGACPVCRKSVNYNSISNN